MGTINTTKEITIIKKSLCVGMFVDMCFFWVGPTINKFKELSVGALVFCSSTTKRGSKNSLANQRASLGVGG